MEIVDDESFLLAEDKLNQLGYNVTYSRSLEYICMLTPLTNSEIISICDLLNGSCRMTGCNKYYHYCLAGNFYYIFLVDPWYIKSKNNL